MAHSYVERNRVKMQDVLELKVGEFYGQLVNSDFSSFKAEIDAPEPGPIPELNPVTRATTQAIKDNFARIQAEVESLFTGRSPSNAQAQPPITPRPVTPSPIDGIPQPHSNGHNLNNEQPLLGENLDF